MDEFGYPVTVVNASNHSFELNEKELENILLQDEIRDKNVVIISVAGAFRKGKSFLLNFMLRYLGGQGWISETGDKLEWMGDENEPLQGFSWRGGAERDTTGILLWNKVFVVPLPSGEQVAVLLMDTQGAFDSTSTVKECATVFALSTMISSIQVYNLSQNIQEDDLQHLELFTEYGRLALEDTHEKPFQKLVFLVRDWSFPYDAPFGEEGGREILDRRLQISDRQHPQLQQLRKHIKSCFSEVSCFLMPHPGLEVATNYEFDGRLSEIRDEFKDHLEILLSKLLSPSNLLPKKIGGRCITARELIAYFKTYVEIFKGDTLPEPKSMLQATAEANNLSAVASAKEFYNNTMEKICGGNCPFIKQDTLEKKHMKIYEAAVQKFTSIRKMGSEELCEHYLNILKKDLDEMYSSFMKFNESKQLSSAFRTPLVLFVLFVTFYLNSALMHALGLHAVSVFSNAIMAVCLISLAIWGYSRYTGELQYIGIVIDDMVATIINNLTFFSPRLLSEVMSDNAHPPPAS